MMDLALWAQWWQDQGGVLEYDDPTTNLEHSDEMDIHSYGMD